MLLSLLLLFVDDDVVVVALLVGIAGACNAAGTDGVDFIGVVLLLGADRLLLLLLLPFVVAALFGVVVVVAVADVVGKGGPLPLRAQTCLDALRTPGATASR